MSSREDIKRRAVWKDSHQSLMAGSVSRVSGPPQTLRGGFLLTSIIFIEGVHAGEVDGEGLEGRRQADATLRALHVKARRGARVRRLGQAWLGIFHAQYGSRRLGRM